jgi:hypothetical protein
MVDQRPNLPAALQKAADLLPKVTASHVFSFGYEGVEPENYFQKWSPSPLLRTGLDVRLGRAALAQVVFCISGALPILPLFFRFVVLVTIHLYDSL